MITLYTWTTPNGRKVPIMLEELGLPYEVRPINIGKREQFHPAYLAISPNNKIPAIVDPDAEGGPLAIFESGAILTYLAETHGRFLPAAGPARYRALEWLHWQVGGLGPMLGQFGFFVMRAPEKSELAIGHFTEEADRLIGVMERRLSESRFLGGDDYSIADIAAYPWTQMAAGPMQVALPKTWEKSPSVKRWLAEVGERPAVQRGMAVPKV
jgi:GST-like protein